MSNNILKFYQHFQAAVASLDTEIVQLSSASSRQNAIDTIRLGIAHLSNELADAAEYLPTYDQKSYAETIKGLTEKLDREVDKVAPRQRFQFKARSRNAAQESQEDRRHNVGVLASYQDTQAGSAAPSKQDELAANAKDYNQEIKGSSSSAVRRPSFSAAKTVSLSQHKELHVVLAPSASQAATYGDLTDLEACVIDMSAAARGEVAFSGLALKNLRKCIIVTGSVDGPVHITGISDSILVVASRQVRIHECKNVKFYLHCSSHPIIEDCTQVQFAPIPECYTPRWSSTHENKWDQVDDFKWLKADHSPNWSILPESGRLSGSFWTEWVAGGAEVRVADILNKGGIS
ncbi:hypothetical protein jhhlp_003004 [Lomentospora prolificans]|uniref:C-CAP/cofactor C-like domain-containing protein n=1 Tax=Lomentospora prolificans TaxID=41688 RepID=A0A2N3NFN8_9PEZI|nr:hypothetical protein jhhlp_003004 [Lomentospora prolificans]